MTFLWAETICFYLVVLIIPKRRPRHEILTTILFALLVSVLTDEFLDVKYHLYWYFSKNEVDWRYLIVLLGQPPVLILILNFFPTHTSLIKKSMYIVCCTIFLMFLEVTHVYLFPILFYGSWNIWYSGVVYLCSLIGITLLFRYVREKKHQSSY